jgi:hypothetical protein
MISLYQFILPFAGRVEAWARARQLFRQSLPLVRILPGNGPPAEACREYIAASTE